MRHVGKPDMSDADRPEAWAEDSLIAANEQLLRVRASADIAVGVRNGGVLLTVGGVTHGIPAAQMEAALPAIEKAIEQAKKPDGPSGGG